MLLIITEEVEITITKKEEMKMIFLKGTAKPRDNRGRDDQRGYNVDQNLWKQEDT